MILEEQLSAAQELAQKAGRRTLDFFGKAIKVEHKDDQSPLTEADRSAHRIIYEGLKSLDPQLPVISEEGETVPFEQREKWESYWLVDPLDGTKEFIRAIPDYTVNIALIHKGEPILGVVEVPATGEQFYAAQGLGAFKKGKQFAKKIKTNSTTPSNLKFAISRSHPSQVLSQFLGGFKGAEIIQVGSALKMCRVSEGVVDAYPRMGPIMEWDTAAAHAVLVEAGGLLADWNKEPLGYNKPILTHPGFLVSANPLTDKAIRQAWKKAASKS